MKHFKHRRDAVTAGGNLLFVNLDVMVNMVFDQCLCDVDFKLDVMGWRTIGQHCLCLGKMVADFRP